MRNRTAVSLITIVIGLVVTGFTVRMRSQGVAGPPAAEWPAYAHDAEGTKYSPAAQITTANVTALVPVWTYRTGDYALTRLRDETTPLYIDGALYASTPFGGVRALDGATGRELWAFDSELEDGDYGDLTNRGVSTWVDTRAPASAPCRRRIFIATVDARLIALDARTGARCAQFGESGQIHLDRSIAPGPQYLGEIGMTSPPAVVDDTVIVGSTVADNQRAAAPPGVVRAFDARTGDPKWAWDPIPRSPAQRGYDTWRGPKAHATGAANAWSIISVDAARDLVFVPVGSASPDYYGGERLGQNLFASSVVALRASTGALVWHFQAVHHDLWDYDVPAQPVLFTFHRDGRDVPALAQATKMGHLFVLNRETGKPIFPVEERPVPASDVAGEEAWPTQPFPVRPRPLVPEGLTPKQAFGVTDEARAWCRDRIAFLRSEGIFTPPSIRGSIVYPGNVGGSNWSGVALDPIRNLAFLPLNNLAAVVELIPREKYSDAMERSGRDFEIAPQAGTAFAMQRKTPLAAPDGVPCTPPPFGTLTAVDLQSGDVKWEVPFGRIDAFASMPGSERWGSPNLGGSMVTGGGLVFAGGTLDNRLHAFDEQSGAELWSWKLPAGVHAAPMTYFTSTGRQLIVVAAGGHKDLHSKPGDYLVAFGLPGAEQKTSRQSRIESGRYVGHMVLDVTRGDAVWDVRLEGGKASVDIAMRHGQIRGIGAGTVSNDAIALDVRWQYPAGNCSGGMKLSGALANEGTALIGELTYDDGCNGGVQKGGTFGVWRGPRTVTSLAR